MFAAHVDDEFMTEYEAKNASCAGRVRKVTPLEFDDTRESTLITRPRESCCCIAGK